MGMLGAGTPPASKQIEAGEPARPEAEVLNDVIVNETESGQSN